ncbi:methyltransferase domain-containing protein [Coprinopsis marcescibilis]|uniref:Alpha N-terminal protein methyltransferase 1 n=1 Tax=Coprinopsis marcescibilis TaxID=230819 RepID=A0A5C3LB35_COPMA|nr:methyltransferase domain-containing protein [Coprinopsis marcescibilis]
MTNAPEKAPDVEEGIEYWNNQPANYDGVLGGFGTGSLPRIESLGSRLFLLGLYPELSTVPSAYKPLREPEHFLRVRALDVGAGVGRVTSDTLLPLVSDVVLLEPVEIFVQEAATRARASAAGSTSTGAEERSHWPGLQGGSKSVTVLQGTLQEFDPLNPHRTHFIDRIGYQPARPADDIGLGYDIIWCQWCLGHLSDEDLVAFFVRCQAALKPQRRSLIVVKENLCSDLPDSKPLTIFDDQDSSLTRSDLAWKVLFKQAGLKIVREKVQEGLPEGLYTVKMYVLGLSLTNGKFTDWFMTGMRCDDYICLFENPRKQMEMQ